MSDFFNGEPEDGEPMSDQFTILGQQQRIAELESERDHWKDECMSACDNCERLRAAARKTLKEQDEADDHHSAACMNWSLLEHSQHQCGLCDLRAALRGG